MFDGKYLEWNQKRIKAIIDFYGHKFMFKKNVLDLGSGQGDIGGALHRLGAEITLVDARQEHLQMAQKKFQGINILRADLDQDWPFQHKRFDLIIDLGLLCHLRDFKQHIINVCNTSSNLVLETAVCDSDDPNTCIRIDESKSIYDNAVNGIGCRPSAAAVEKVLADCGMTFERMDSDKLNAGPFVYNWQPKNDGDTSINKRRLWFCFKTGNSSQPYQNTMVKHFPRHIPPLPIAGTAPPPQSIAEMIGVPGLPEVRPQGSLPVYPITVPTSTDDEVKAASRKFAITPENAPSRYPNLKVLYLPLGHQQGMIDGFNNLGVQLQTYDFLNEWNRHGKNANPVNQQFIEMVKDFQPNLIHCQFQMTGIISPESIREARKLSPGVIVINWSGDIRQHVINELKTMSTAVDYTLISSTGQLEMYRNAGCPNMRYWQVGFDPKFNFPMYLSNFKYDVSFIGNSYGHFPDSPIRQDAVNKCRQVFTKKFGLFGAGWGGSATCDPKQGNQIYNESVCALSISHFNSVSHYFSDRLLYCVASGRPTISWYYPGCESYFENKKEIFYVKSVQEIVDVVNYCAANPEEATKVGIAGAARAQAEHTFTSKALELLYITGLVK